MTHHTILADNHAELISGGWRSTRTSLFNFKKVPTSIGQTNDVTNVGIGLLGGLGNADSFQVSSADVANFVR